MEIKEPVIREEENGDDDGIGGVDQGDQIPPLEDGPQLRRIIREHQPSTRYPCYEYILIVDGGGGGGGGSLKDFRKYSLKRIKTIG